MLEFLNQLLRSCIVKPNLNEKDIEIVTESFEIAKQMVTNITVSANLKSMTSSHIELLVQATNLLQWIGMIIILIFFDQKKCTISFRINHSVLAVSDDFLEFLRTIKSSSLLFPGNYIGATEASDLKMHIKRAEQIATVEGNVDYFLQNFSTSKIQESQEEEKEKKTYFQKLRNCPVSDLGKILITNLYQANVFSDQDSIILYDQFESLFGFSYEKSLFVVVSPKTIAVYPQRLLRTRGTRVFKFTKTALLCIPITKIVFIGKSISGQACEISFFSADRIRNVGLLSQIPGTVDRLVSILLSICNASLSKFSSIRSYSFEDLYFFRGRHASKDDLNLQKCSFVCISNQSSRISSHILVWEKRVFNHPFDSWLLLWERESAATSPSVLTSVSSIVYVKQTDFPFPRLIIGYKSSLAVFQIQDVGFISNIVRDSWYYALNAALSKP